MPPSLPKQPQPEPKNNCPDCLYLKLEGIPVQPDSQDYLEFWHTVNQTQPIDLHLTINFSEQWESLKIGRVKFGLKGGELRLKLQNGEIPYEARELAGSVELCLQKQEPGDSKDQKEIAPPLRPKSFSFDRSRTKVQSSVSTDQNRGRTDQFQVAVCHITTKVSEENPVWVFEEEMGEPVLRGLLNKVKLATLSVITFPCRVEATFEVSKRDVCLTDAEGLWPPDISRNKRAVLDRLIIQRLLEPKLKPYLSRAELQYD